MISVVYKKTEPVATQKKPRIRFLQHWILAAGIITVTAGCRPFWLLTVEPNGPPEYQLGWQDGCDTGISAEGEWSYKLMYGFKKRPEMSANDQYKQGWNEGFTYCRFSFAASKAPGKWEDIGFGSGF